MTKQEYTLTCLQEECAEVIQIISKIKRFGADSFHPDDPEKVTNAENLAREIMDLMAVIQMVGAEGVLPEITPREAGESIQRKIDKVEFYMKASRAIGILEQDAEQEPPAND
jgi:hypothetical protein